jgi:hypothetical protein
MPIGGMVQGFVVIISSNLLIVEDSPTLPGVVDQTPPGVLSEFDCEINILLNSRSSQTKLRPPIENCPFSTLRHARHVT